MKRAKTREVHATRSVKNLTGQANDIAKKTQEASAKEKTDPAWTSAGSADGLQIWRIEKFTVKSWPKEKYGQFFAGDSYIVLFTYRKGNAKQYDIHFWLGDETSQDEAGTAAYKTVELDNHLGGTPVEHREVQGSESQKFLSYFPNGIRIMSGGIETGFNHVEPAKYRPRLLHIKGNMKSTTIQEVELDASSLNSEDVFVLDNGLEVFQWNGKKADPGERMRGGALTRDLNSERNGKVAKPIIMDEGNEDQRFWDILGGKEEIGATSEFRSAGPPAPKRLFKLSDASGKLTFTEVAKGKVLRSQLLPEDVFIFDNGTEVFAWVGSKTSPAEKKNALISAENYLTDYGRPIETPISRVVQGHESEEFDTSFDG